MLRDDPTPVLRMGHGGKWHDRRQPRERHEALDGDDWSDRYVHHPR